MFDQTNKKKQVIDYTLGIIERLENKTETADDRKAIINMLKMAVHNMKK